MKSVLISIQPKGVEEISSGEKTIEVRKTRPKCEVPFKCYIYKTMGKRKDLFAREIQKYFNCGKIVGEFVCDRIDDLRYVPTKYCLQPAGTWEEMICNNSCLSFDQIKEYAKGKTIYGWHISNLKIYDKPKAITEFKGVCRQQNDVQCENCPYCDWSVCKDFCKDKRRIITRPPQSWCYVEVGV